MNSIKNILIIFGSFVIFACNFIGEFVPPASNSTIVTSKTPLLSLTPTPFRISRLQVPPTSHLFHGIYPGQLTGQESGVTLNDLLAYEELAGKKAAWVYFSNEWFEGREFPLSTVSWIRDYGSIPFIRLMLRSSSEQNKEEPVFKLQSIIDGEFDSDLQVWCRSARDFDYPLLVEYGTEMNGQWFPWNGIWHGGGETSNYGNRSEPDGPERFRDAFRHIIQICRTEGADNITWVFHVNANDNPGEDWNALENYYPGDEWIDWIAVSLYGTQTPLDEESEEFRVGMDAVYSRLESLAGTKPVIIAEFGLTNNNPLVDQAEWAQNALMDLTSSRWPRVIGFSWWNEGWQNDDDPAHDTNMRLQDNPKLAAVFKEFVGNNPVVLDSISSEPGISKPNATIHCERAEPVGTTELKVNQPPSLMKPDARVPFRDPVFGTCLIRVTDSLKDFSENASLTGLKNEYSRVQAFNSNGTKILVLGIDSTWYIYDAINYQPTMKLPIEGPLDPRWSEIDPTVLYYSEATRLMSINIQTMESEIVHDFSDDFAQQQLTAVWSRFEGSPSFDGTSWGLMAEDDNWLTSALIIYDLPSNRITASSDTRNWPKDAREIDSVTISPLGNYFLVYMDKYCEKGQLGTIENPCGLMVFDKNLKNGRGLLRLIGHSDTAIDGGGKEVLIYQDIDTDEIAMLDLTSGTITPLLPIDFSHTAIGFHFSGRATRVPGWALVSTYDNAPASYTWMDDRVFAIELKPGGRIVTLVHTHSLVDANLELDYWAEPQATVDRDFSKVLFTSNWGRSGTSEVDMYAILLEPGWDAFAP